MPNLDNPITSFTTNSFIKNPYSTILQATSFGVILMTISISLGTPVIVSMLALFLGIFIVYGYHIGKVEYSLYPFGIHQSIKKFIPNMVGNKVESRLITWDLIDSYLIDEDLSRSLKPYSFIKLYLSISPKQIWITDQIDKNGFNEFKREFEKLVEKHQLNRGGNDHRAMHQNQKTEDIRPQFLKTKKSFYSTAFAKVVTILFVVFTLYLGVSGLLLGLHSTSLVKAAIFIIPGTLYMVYRTFYKSNHKM